MTPKEWHELAIERVKQGASLYAQANQAMYDARRALVYAQQPDRMNFVDGVLHNVSQAPSRLQELLNRLLSDPILDEPKDIDSAGEREPSDEGAE